MTQQQDDSIVALARELFDKLTTVGGVNSINDILQFGIKAGMELERAKVVEWLRYRAGVEDSYDEVERSIVLADCAAAIEAGRHHGGQHDAG